MRSAHEVLAVLVAADEAACEPLTFVLHYTGEGPVIIGHRGWSDDGVPPTEVEVDDLEDRGWVRITERQGKGRHFAVNSDGRDEARRGAARASQPTAPAVDIGWPVARQVLRLTYDAYVAAGAVESGVMTAGVLNNFEDPGSARAALRELVHGGYLEDLAEMDNVTVPQLVRPTPRALELVAGWPGSAPQAALYEFVAALDHEIAITKDENNRARLGQIRDGVLGVGRDVFLHWLEKKAEGL